MEFKNTGHLDKQPKISFYKNPHALADHAEKDEQVLVEIDGPITLASLKEAIFLIDLQEE